MKFKTMGKGYLGMLRYSMKGAEALHKFAVTRTKRLAVMAGLIFVLNCLASYPPAWVVTTLIGLTILSWVIDRYRR